MVTRNLVSVLEQTSALLRSVNATFWAERIDELLNACNRKLSSWEAQELLSWNGGMGSFTDLLILAANGHNVREEDEALINHRLGELQDIIFEEASRMTREG